MSVLHPLCIAPCFLQCWLFLTAFPKHCHFYCLAILSPSTIFFQNSLIFSMSSLHYYSNSYWPSFILHYNLFSPSCLTQTFFLFGFTYQKLKHDTFDFHTPKHLILYHTELIQHFNRITMSLKTVKLFSHQGEIIYVPLGIHAIIIFLAI